MSSLSCDEVRDLAAGYVLDALEPDEADAVRSHLRSCARPHPEFAALGGVVPYLAADVDPIEPATSLRARILDAVQPEVSASAPTPGPRVTGRRWSGLLERWSRPLLAATAIAVLVLGASTAYLGQRLLDTRAYADTLVRASALAAAPGSRAIRIGPAPGGGAGEVQGVAVLAADGRGIVVTEGLASTHGAEVYEVWYVAGTNAPIPAGSFHVDSEGRGWLERLPGAPAGPLTIAVTREPGPGATTPTLPILAAGSSGT